MAEITLTAANFEAEVLKSEVPVLVDFWATWCGPCRMLGPVIGRIAEERTDIKVGKVNVDDEPQLAMQYGIEAIPTLIVFKGGRIAAKSMGYRPQSEIEKML